MKRALLPVAVGLLLAVGPGGGSATLVATGEAASSKVYVKGTGRGDFSLHYRPRTLMFGTRSVLVGLRWSTWNGPRAVGRGRVAFNDCIPSCAEGRSVEYAVRVTLASRSTCGTRNRRYRRLRFSYTGAAPPGLSRTYRERFPC
jgi:hypothetical protein